MPITKCLPIVTFGLLAFLTVGCSEETKEITSITEKVSFNHLEGFLSGPMLIDGGHLYAATGSGTLKKLDLESGEIIWTYEGENDDKMGFINNTPVLYKNSVLSIGVSNVLTSVDQENGEKQWSRLVGKWTLDDKPVSPTRVVGCFGCDAAHDRLIIGDSDGQVFGVDPKDGSLLWTKSIGAKLSASPVFKDGVAFVSSMGGRIHALKVENGSDFWSVSKMLVKKVKGAIKNKIDDDGNIIGDTYHLKVEYTFNFDLHDHFGGIQDGGHNEVTLELFDKNNQLIEYKAGDKMLNAVKLEIGSVDQHLGSGSHTEKKDLELSALPSGPLKVVLKDVNGKEIHSIEAEVTFEKPKSSEDVSHQDQT